MATIGPARLWAIVALFETWRGLGACGQLQCGSLYDGALATYYGLVQAVAFVAVLVKPSSSQLFVAAMVLRLLPFLPKFTTFIHFQKYPKDTGHKSKRNHLRLLKKNKDDQGACPTFCQKVHKNEALSCLLSSYFFAKIQFNSV